MDGGVLHTIILETIRSHRKPPAILIWAHGFYALAEQQDEQGLALVTAAFE
jgi:hypothetical protein